MLSLYRPALCRGKGKITFPSFDAAVKNLDRSKHAGSNITDNSLLRARKIFTRTTDLFPANVKLLNIICGSFNAKVCVSILQPIHGKKSYYSISASGNLFYCITMQKQKES